MNRQTTPPIARKIQRNKTALRYVPWAIAAAAVGWAKFSDDSIARSVGAAGEESVGIVEMTGERFVNLADAAVAVIDAIFAFVMAIVDVLIAIGEALAALGSLFS